MPSMLTRYRASARKSEGSEVRDEPPNYLESI